MTEYSDGSDDDSKVRTSLEFFHIRSKSNFDFQPRDISNMPSREINRSQIQKIKNIYHIQNNHSANFKPVLPTRNK